jgi:hypothetical protein
MASASPTSAPFRALCAEELAQRALCIIRRVKEAPSAPAMRARALACASSTRPKTRRLLTYRAHPKGTKCVEGECAPSRIESYNHGGAAIVEAVVASAFARAPRRAHPAASSTCSSTVASRRSGSRSLHSDTAVRTRFARTRRACLADGPWQGLSTPSCRSSPLAHKRSPRDDPPLLGFAGPPLLDALDWLRLRSARDRSARGMLHRQVRVPRHRTLARPQAADLASGRTRPAVDRHS